MNHFISKKGDLNCSVFASTTEKNLDYTDTQMFKYLKEWDYLLYDNLKIK